MRYPSPPMRPSRTCSRRRLSWSRSPGGCSTSRTISATRTTTSRRTRQSRPPTSYRNGTSCPSMRSCARSRTSSAASFMFGSIVVLAFLPWLDTSKVRSTAYRPTYKQFFWLFVAVCVLLGWLGSKPAEGYYVLLARICTLYYFAHFIIVLPLIGLFEKPLPLPNSIWP